MIHDWAARVACLAGCLLALEACGGGAAEGTLPGSGAALTPVRAGRWGGLHLELDVTATGGRARFDCAKGTVDEPLVADSSGGFHARGTVTSTAGPVNAEHPHEPVPASYDGKVEGDSMTVTVAYTREDGGSGTATYVLAYGAPGVHNELCALSAPPGSAA